MPEQSIELHAIMARLERVEKENRRLKLAGIMFLLVTCAVVVTGQSQTNRTLEAERFVLKDQSGKIRAELSTENGLQSSLKFYDETGNKRKEAAQKGRGSRPRDRTIADMITVLVASLPN